MQSTSVNAKQTNSAYINSDVYHKLTSNPIKKIAFLDIDGTVTGNAIVANMIRETLENNGFAIAAVTTRTEEMLMSHDVYEKSVVKNNFSRPRPNLKAIHGKFAYVRPEEFEPQGILNPEIIIGSTGTQILLRHEKSYYLADSSYEQKYNFPNDWRNKTREFLDIVEPLHELYELPVIDDIEKYKNGFADVAPPQFRLGLQFRSLQDKIHFNKKIQSAMTDAAIPKPIRDHAATLSLINDSHPRNNHFKLYLVPQNTNKKTAVDHTITYLKELFNADIDQFELLFAGDSLPDLEMGIYAGKGAKATFILSGGSRLTNILTDKKNHTFAGENLQPIKKKLVEVSQGIYTYTEQNFTRTVILSDLYSDKTEAASIYEVLQKEYFQK